MQNKGTSEGPEWFQTDCIWVQVIPLIIQDQIYTIQRSPIPQTSNWSGTFFDVSYSKPALATSVENGDHNGWHKINTFWGVLSFPTYQNQEMLDLVHMY